MMSMSHAAAARHHACRRLWQRFGLAFSPAELKALENEIVAGRGQWIADQPEKTRTIYRLLIRRPERDRDIFAVFDVRLWAICTVLPCEEWVGRKKCRRTRRGS